MFPGTGFSWTLRNGMPVWGMPPAPQVSPYSVPGWGGNLPPAAAPQAPAWAGLNLDEMAKQLSQGQSPAMDMPPNAGRFLSSKIRIPGLL